MLLSSGGDNRAEPLVHQAFPSLSPRKDFNLLTLLLTMVWSGEPQKAIYRVLVTKFGLLTRPNFIEGLEAENTALSRLWAACRPLKLRLLHQSITQSQSRSPALERSTQEIKVEWNLP